MSSFFSIFNFSINRLHRSQNLLSLPRRVDKPNPLEYLQKLCLVQCHYLDRLFRDHKYNHKLCKCTSS